MIRWFPQLDAVLRGDALRRGSLDGGSKGKAGGTGTDDRVSLRGLACVVILLTAIYGLAAGSFAAIRTGGDQLMQMVASAVKLPLLFGLTLLVTLPSLYVFSALVGARLRFGAVCRLLTAMVGVVAAVLASFAPIVVFFGISTTSYPFMKLLNVVMCGIAGLLGLAFLLKTLRALVATGEFTVDQAAPVTHVPPAEVASGAVPPPTNSTAAEATSAAARFAATHMTSDQPTSPEQGIMLNRGMQDRRARAVFRIWVLLFAVVGMQMSWVLRPFIGHPDLPFAWFRARESNFFLDVLQALGKLLGIES